MKGSDLALMEPCSDSQGIAVGSRIVGEHFMEYQYCLVNDLRFWLFVFFVIISR